MQHMWDQSDNLFDKKIWKKETSLLWLFYHNCSVASEVIIWSQTVSRLHGWHGRLTKLHPILTLILPASVCSSLTVRANVAMSVSTRVLVGLYHGPDCQPSATSYSWERVPRCNASGEINPTPLCVEGQPVRSDNPTELRTHFPGQEICYAGTNVIPVNY